MWRELEWRHGHRPHFLTRLYCLAAGMALMLHFSMQKLCQVLIRKEVIQILHTLPSDGRTFALEHHLWEACGIVDRDTIVMTGGGTIILGSLFHFLLPWTSNQTKQSYNSNLYSTSFRSELPLQVVYKPRLMDRWLELVMLQGEMSKLSKKYVKIVKTCPNYQQIFVKIVKCCHKTCQHC